MMAFLEKYIVTMNENEQRHLKELMDYSKNTAAQEYYIFANIKY